MLGTDISIGAIFLISCPGDVGSAAGGSQTETWKRDSAGFRRAALLLFLSMIPDCCSQRSDAGGQEGQCSAWERAAALSGGICVCDLCSKEVLKHHQSRGW